MFEGFQAQQAIVTCKVTSFPPHLQWGTRHLVFLHIDIGM